MKTITMTYLSSRKTARVECDRLVKQNPDIELVALTSGVDPRDVWMALSRSEIAVFDEEIMQYDEDHGEYKQQFVELAYDLADALIAEGKRRKEVD